MTIVNRWDAQADRVRKMGKKPYFAPTEPEMKVQEQHLTELAGALGRPPVMLVLGATPELADLGLRNGCRVYRVDISAVILRAVKIRQDVRDREAETVLCCDWKHMPDIATGAIDFVVGDASLNNVPDDDMPTLFEELRRVTHPRSMFSLKQIVLPDRIPRRYRYDAAMAEFRSGIISENELFNILRFPCFSDELYQPATRTLDAVDVYAAIVGKRNEGAMTDAEFALLYSKRGTIRHTIYRQSEQLSVFETHLGECRIVHPQGALFYKDIKNIFRITPHSSTG